MPLYHDSRDRILAIGLTCLTFVIHAVLVHCALQIHSGHIRSWCGLALAFYNALAAGASMLGLFGAVKMNPAMVSAYAIAHTTTLLLTTLVLFNIILPIDLRSIIPIIPNVGFDVVGVCQEIDDSFGWDEGWLDRCAASFQVVRTGAAWLGLVLLAAQWWAVSSLWRWSQELIAEENALEKVEIIDLEKADQVEERERLKTIQGD